MILDQTLKTRRIGKALGDQKPDCDRKLVFLSWKPAVDILKECWECRLLKGFLKIFVSDQEKSGVMDKNGGKNDYLLVSLLMTSMYFFMSSTSAGSLALKIVKGDTGAPSSTKLPPG